MFARCVRWIDGMGCDAMRLIGRQGMWAKLGLVSLSLVRGMAGWVEVRMQMSLYRTEVYRISIRWVVGDDQKEDDDDDDKCAVHHGVCSLDMPCILRVCVQRRRRMGVGVRDVFQSDVKKKRGSEVRIDCRVKSELELFCRIGHVAVTVVTKKEEDRDVGM